MKTPTDVAPSPTPDAPATGSPLPAPFPTPGGVGNNGHAHRALPSSAARRGRGWALYLAGALGLLALAGGIAAFVLTRQDADRPDVILHAVKRENISVTVTEKGTLESAENKDVVCKVKAGSKGAGSGFATSINWVIEDGARVEAEQLLMILDDSALQEQLRAQKITVDQALSAKITAEKQYDITVKLNEQKVAEAETALTLGELDLEKYTGLSFDPTHAGLAALAGVPAALTEDGSFRQEADDLTGQVRLAESDVEQNQERAAWAERMVKMRYMSAAQAQAEQSRLASSREKLRSLQSKLSLMRAYERKKMLTDLRSKVENAGRALRQAELVAEAEEAKARIERATKVSIYDQEVAKLRDIESQIKECRIYAPQAGMVVYFKNESSRFGSSPQNLIEQGAQVKEGQKLLRIPNLNKMQVNTKVHEAMVARILPDVRVSTGLTAGFRTGMLANPDPFSRLLSLKEDVQEDVREKFRDKEYVTASRGQAATVRVDAMADRQLRGRVRSVAGVASQVDSWSSDVKLYQTIVLIEDPVPGLKPDMSADVSIHIEGIQNVLTVPLQAVVGGTEMGAKRKLFVKTPTGYDEREVTLGLYNEKVVEVREGLAEGDEVVLNPKVLLGDSKAKTRDADGNGNGKAGKGTEGAEGGKAAGPGAGPGAVPGEDGPPAKKGGDPTKKRKGGAGGPKGPPTGDVPPG